MDKRERLNIQKIIDVLVTVWLEVELMATNERNKYDNLSPGIRVGKRGRKLGDNVERLDEQANEVKNVADELHSLL